MGVSGMSPEDQAKMQQAQKQKEFDGMFAGTTAYKDLVKQQADVNDKYKQVFAQQGDRPGIALTEQNKFEKEAGVTPPGYEGTRDVRTGKLLADYKTDPYSGEANQLLKKQAFSEGLSPWAEQQMKSQKLLQQDQSGLAGRQAMQAQRGAQQQLATSGGLRGGASALLARQGQRDLLNAQQGISRGGMGQRMGIEQQDMDRKQGLLGGFADKEAGAQQANIGQATGDINRKSGFDMERYRQQMQAWGAKQSADAQRAAGSGGGGGGLLGLGNGCFMTTACVEAMGMDDTCWVLETARHFRDTYMSQTPDLANEAYEYYAIAPGIVDNIKSQENHIKTLKSLFWRRLVPFVLLVKQGKLEDAHVKYKQLIQAAKDSCK